MYDPSRLLAPSSAPLLVLLLVLGGGACADADAPPEPPGRRAAAALSVAGTLPGDRDGDGVQDADEDLDGDGELDPGESDPDDPCDPDPAHTACLTSPQDLDGDGLLDRIELALGTDRFDADSDDDGRSDATELGFDGVYDVGIDTDPRLADTDGDRIQDGTEVGDVTAVPDPDGAGRLLGTDLTRWQPDADIGNPRTDPLLADTDGDRIQDGAEDRDRNGRLDPGESSPTDACDPDPSHPACPERDRDLDGVPDADEPGLGTSPDDRDSDDDGLSDGEEIGEDGVYDAAVDTDPADADSDGDGIQDGTERGRAVGLPDLDGPGPLLGTDAARFVPDGDAGATTTDPLHADSDDDGLDDGDEDADRDGVVDADESDPNDPCDPSVEPLVCATIDTDRDGLDDRNEVLVLGTDRFDADSDDDGLSDGEEVGRDDVFDAGVDTDPRLADTDDDGIQDGTERGERLPVVDPDGDGPLRSTDLAVFQPDEGLDSTTDPLRADTDGDGVDDGVEDTDANGRVDPGESDPRNPCSPNPLHPACPVRDSDGDGLLDADEPLLGTSHLDIDSDDDGIADNVELGGDGVFDAGADTSPARADSDGDGVQDGTELGLVAGLPDPDGDSPLAGTNPLGFIPDNDPETTTEPLDADTDGDGLCDGPAEVAGTCAAGEDRDADGAVDGLDTDPNDVDTDDGGAEDGTEVLVDGTDPRTPSDDVGFDFDSDGLRNEREAELGTDPEDTDSDDDGLLDGVEVGALGGTNPTDPTDADSDDDGLGDGQEDRDADGSLDAGETDPNDPDSDNGGVGDGVEVGRGTDPLDPDDDLPPAERDPDGDGLDAGREAALGTDPNDPDSDDDGLCDGGVAVSDVCRAGEDRDGDGVVDPAETDPTDADSDDDGLLDGFEVDPEAGPGTDPLFADSDTDGLLDGTELGLTADDVGDDTDLTRFIPDLDPTTRTDPNDVDSDDGGIADGDEDSDRNGRVDPGETDPLDPEDDACVDPFDCDGDGLDDEREAELGTDPYDADSDGGGVGDGDEVAAGTDPLDPADDFPVPVVERRLEVGGGSLYGCSVAEVGDRAPSPWLLLLGMGLVAAKARRRSGRAGIAALAAVLCASGLAAPAPARAQGQSEPPTRFVPQRFEPATTRSAGYFALPGARSLGVGFYDLGVLFDHADDVLVLRDAATGERLGALVGDQLRVHVLASVGLTDWLDLGVGLPVYLSQSGELLADLPGAGAGDVGAGVGDLRVVPRLRLAGPPEGPGTALALLVSVWVPTGQRADYRGEAFRLRPSVVLEHGARSGVRVAFEAGFLVRDEARLLELRVDDSVELGAALAVPLGAGARVEALFELQSALSVHSGGETQMPLELLAGGRWHASEAVHVDLGTGLGLVGGYGAPDWRVVGGVSFTRPRVHDLDGDGLVDDTDVCVAAAEDFDGFEDLDGCPDDDNDGDTVPDTLDGPLGAEGFGACRDLAEDFDGFEDDDGCPDDDNDRDGIPDVDDECPADTEDFDLFEDDDGCPELDNDRDGVPDIDDQCPSDPAPAGGDGCP